MRFLLGLILGAGAVLLLAEAATGEGVWRDRVAAAVAGVDHWLAETPWRPAELDRAVDSVEPAERPAVDPAVAERIAAGGPVAAGDRVTAADPDAATEPMAAADLDAAADPMAAADPIVMDPVTALAADREPANRPEPRPLVAPEPALQPIPRPPDPRPVDGLQVHAPQTVPARAPVPMPGTDVRSASVWVPFHSEMSASGFASRLSEALDHPFRVERRGPGHYQVVFRYHDEPEREALLALAERATGLPL